MAKVESKVKPIVWEKDKLLVLDQRLLPYEKEYLKLTSYKQIIEAISSMTLRGAPLIGIAAAYGMALAAHEFVGAYHGTPLIGKLRDIGEEIKQSRSTAINLSWAVDLVLSDVKGLYDKEKIIDVIEKRAVWIHEDDEERCRKIGENGVSIIPRSARVLTICNTGALATGGIGTAFGVILTAYKKDPTIKVFVSETRPRQQGSRLTTFECLENGIECTLISDTACGYLMQKKEIDVVITGADRIASNGDVANKIGTYQLAVLAKENNVPFYVAAPLSTFDLKVKSGSEIPIEERSEKEVTDINGKPICAPGTKVRNPAFDVTPGRYITGIITEKGILQGDYKKEILKVFNATVVV